jgi:hypothetical protein
MTSQDVWSIDEWVLSEHRVRWRALRAGSEGAAWRVRGAARLRGRSVGRALLLACRIMGARPHENFWAALVGVAIMLFFALLALAHTLPYVALEGFALCLLTFARRKVL